MDLPILDRYVNILGPLALILRLALAMAIFQPRFFLLTNLMIILQDAAIYMVLGTAMTIVITGKGIDLSIASSSSATQ